MQVQTVVRVHYMRKSDLQAGLITPCMYNWLTTCSSAALYKKDTCDFLNIANLLPSFFLSFPLVLDQFQSKSTISISDSIYWYHPITMSACPVCYLIRPTGCPCTPRTHLASRFYINMVWYSRYAPVLASTANLTFNILVGYISCKLKSPSIWSPLATHIAQRICSFFIGYSCKS